MALRRVVEVAIGVLTLVGCASGIVAMTPLLLGGVRGFLYESVVMLTLVLYGVGIWGAIQAFRRRPGWERVTRWFWFAQAPLVLTPMIGWSMFTGVGTWLFVRLSWSYAGVGWTAFIGSGHHWHIGHGPAEFVIGINVVALAIAVVLQSRIG